MRRVRLMRDSILKRRTRIDEVQVKGPSRELARLQTDKERVDSQNKAWLDNLEDNNSSSKNVCLFCGRQFDRRAVLLSHLKVCAMIFSCGTTYVEIFSRDGWFIDVSFPKKKGLPAKEEAQHTNNSHQKSGS